jgi:hypothetical protein
MRLRVRRVLASTATLAVVMAGLPAAAAYSADGGGSCNDGRPPGTPAYVQCVWLNTPEEAGNIARFWLNGDSANLKDAGPITGYSYTCAQGNACVFPEDAEGDGLAHDDGDPIPPGYVEPTGAPDCEAAASNCSIEPSEATVGQTSQ